jgi:hypothetical protein
MNMETRIAELIATYRASRGLFRTDEEVLVLWLRDRAETVVRTAYNKSLAANGRSFFNGTGAWAAGESTPRGEELRSKEAAYAATSSHWKTVEKGAREFLAFLEGKNALTSEEMLLAGKWLNSVTTTECQALRVTPIWPAAPKVKHPTRMLEA